MISFLPSESLIQLQFCQWSARVSSSQLVSVTMAAFSEISQSTITPHSQQIYVVRAYPSKEDVGQTIANSAAAQKSWSKVPLTDRIAIGRKFMVTYTTLMLRVISVTLKIFQEEFKAMSEEIATELTWQMGR